MTVFSIESLAYLRSHHGIASGRALGDVGITPGDLRRLVEAGNLVSVLRGVYRMPAVPFDELARCVAVCAAHPGAVISGPTAGRLWGLRRLPSDHRVHILAPPSSHPTVAPWVVPYRTRAFHAADVHRRDDGIAVTDRARTALDLARVVSSTDLLSIIEQVVSDGRLTDDELRSTAIDWMSPRRPWIRRFLEALDGRLRGGAAESHGEVVLGDALARSGCAGSRTTVSDRPSRLWPGPIRPGGPGGTPGDRSRPAPDPLRDERSTARRSARSRSAGHRLAGGQGGRERSRPRVADHGAPSRSGDPPPALQAPMRSSADGVR